MKKVYEKPRVYVERMELAEHIAACKLNYLDSVESESCVAVGEMDGYTMVIFASGNPSCLVPNDDACLFTQTSNNVAFNS